MFQVDMNFWRTLFYAVSGEFSKLRASVSLHKHSGEHRHSAVNSEHPLSMQDGGAPGNGKMASFLSSLLCGHNTMTR